jgi:hypothetical protein
VVAWLLATLRAGGPYPVLAISGEQGSAKTVLSKLLKDLVDPSATPPSTPRIWLPANSENRYHPRQFGGSFGQSGWITCAVSDPRVGAIDGGILVFSLWTQQNEKVDWQHFSRKIQSFRQPETGH